MNEAKTTKGGAQDKILRMLLALLLAFSGALAALLQALPSKAYAAETANLAVGSSNYYGGYSTTWMYADGEMAYCANPSASTPGSGAYTKHALSALSGRTAETIADLWFSYGSPGFDKSLWPSTWYDGSEMNANHYAALAHILLSDTYTSDGSYALYGCDADFKSWCKREVIGFGSDGTLINENATGRKILARQGEVPKNFKAFQLYTGEGTQLVLSFSYIPYGKISLAKTSGIKQISDGNSCYSLKGAEYTVYENSDLSGKVGVITTDDKGEGELGELMPGTYYVKETKASPGYALDANKYKVEVCSDTTTPVGGANGVSEIPKSDPVPMLVMKIDATTGKGSPEGSGTLAGAEFTVSFYAGHYSSASAAEASGAPKRTWVFKTDSDGFADYSDEYKVAGPALYRMSNGQPTIPLGTVVIQETKAPVGYNLDDGNGGTPKKFCIKITDDGAQGEAVYTYNSPKSPDTIKRGDYRLVKEIPVEVEADSGIVQESKRVLLPGIQFQLINSSANPIVSPVTKAEVKPGDVVCTITTDDNGLASTKNSASVNGWSKPSDWTGALAYGTYTVHEVIPASVAKKFKAEYGHDVIAVPDWKMAISSEGQYEDPVLVNNHIPQTPLKVIKVDAETGKQIPLQCSFKLLDSKGKVVTYEAHYPETHVMDTWTTNDKGEVMLPMLLEEGSYKLIEVQAPEGYVKAIEGKPFEVGAVYNNWDNPIVVKFQDMPQKATISVIKHDSTNGEPVGESTYIVKAAADIVTPEGTIRAKAGQIVATLVTDGDGYAQTQELYLGTYTVYEAKAKDGFALDIAEKTVTLEYKGQDVAVYDEDLEVVDVPTELKLKKVDAIDPEKPVEGARFRLWSDDGAVDDELITDAEGMIDVPYLKHGKYHLQETEAPEGYVIYDVDEDGNAKVYDLTVNDQGMFEFDDGSMKAVYELVVENMPKTMHTTAIDSDSGAHEGQARGELTIVDVIEYTGIIPGNEYKVTGKLMDKATGEAALDDNGEEIVAVTTFTADAFAGSVEVTFTFDGVELAGKSLVAFETMEYEETEYMVHADIEDVDQTVNIVDIHTQAKNPETDDQTGIANESLKLVDTVEFTGLTPGNTYTMCGHIVDSETGDLLLDADGVAYVCTKEFSPEEADGSIDMEFEIDATGLEGKTTVFTETLVDADSNIIAVHEDLEDEGQSIYFPEIRTNALDGADGDKNVIAAAKAEVIDTVSYKNLVVGKDYTAIGTLMDKETGKPMKDAKGNAITASATFAPGKPDGEVEVKFAFDATGLGNKTGVVFEPLVSDGLEVAVHADIDDEAQTVNFTEPEPEPEGKGYPKTGAMATTVAAGMGGLALLAYGLAGGGSALLKRRKPSEVESLDEE